MVMEDLQEKTSVVHMDVTSEHLEKHDLSSSAARDAAAAERSKSFWQALREERKAVFWSVAVSTAVIMEGYDIVLVTSLFAQPAFAKQFGTSLDGSDNYQLPASWQAALGIAPTLGAILGAFLNGWLALKFGYRNVLLVSLAVMTAFIFILFFAVNLPMLLVGLILCGVPWGVFATLAPAYASEICSLALRGHLTVYVNLCWAIGQLIAAGVLAGFANTDTQWAYRIPFGLQWIFPLPLMIVIWFAPESPWWLVRKGRSEEAAHSLRRLTSKPDESGIQENLALIHHTNEIEDESQSGSSYADCFKGVNLRRTEIACLAWAAQIWCGIPLGGTPAYFFTQAGLSSSNSFYFSVGGLGLACIGTILSWLLIARIGRRPLYVWGLALLTLVLLVVGIAASVSNSSTSSFVQAGFVVVFLLTYYLTVGPVCYAIVAETSAVRLRNKSVCLARITYYVSQVIGNVIEPYMINPTEGDWHGKTAYFWAGTCFVFFVWAWLRLPETGKRSFEELDILFEARIGARSFSTVRIDPYAPHGERIRDD